MKAIEGKQKGKARDIGPASERGREGGGTLEVRIGSEGTKRAPRRR